MIIDEIKKPLITKVLDQPFSIILLISFIVFFFYDRKQLNERINDLDIRLEKCKDARFKDINSKIDIMYLNQLKILKIYNVPEQNPDY